jgi:CRP-like cAMP-binding protein
MNSDIDELRRVPLFSTMDETEIAAIRAAMDENTFAPGQVVMREGEPGNSFHVIIEGNVDFLTQDAAGNELTLDEAGPGGFFGELSMLTG